MKSTLSTFILVFLTANSFAQNDDPSGIVGLWKTEDGSMAIKIDRIGNHFQGRIAWLHADVTSETPSLDKKNPEPHLRNIPLKGNKILRELTYNESGKRWEGGVYYDFEHGTLYNCIVTKENPHRLRITKFLRNPNNTTVEFWRREQ